MDLRWEQKVYEIVLQAQEKSEAELAAFLESACAGDERTRREVVHRLKGIKEVLGNVKKLLD